MSSLVPFVPIGRNRRCLVMSVVGHRYFNRHGRQTNVEIGVLRRQSALSFHARLCDASGSILLDTDPQAGYTRLCLLGA